MQPNPILVHVWNELLRQHLTEDLDTVLDYTVLVTRHLSSNIRSTWLRLWSYLKSTVPRDNIRYFPELKDGVERHSLNIFDIPSAVNSAVLVCNIVVKNAGGHIEHVFHSCYLYNTIIYHGNTKKSFLLTMRLDPILLHMWNMLFGNILRTIGLLVWNFPVLVTFLVTRHYHQIHVTYTLRLSQKHRISWQH